MCDYEEGWKEITEDDSLLNSYSFAETQGLKNSNIRISRLKINNLK